MNEETQQFTRDTNTKESSLFGVSFRGWLTLALIATVCYMSINGIEIKEPLYTLAGMVVGYYFGHSRNKTNKQT